MQDPDNPTSCFDVLRPTNISFELKKFEGSYQAYVESVYCDICFRFSDKDEKDDPTLKILTCYGCKESAHLHCYGEKTAFCEEVLEEENVRINRFICEKCEKVGPMSEENCILCSRRGGILKSTSSGWIHQGCALFANNFELENVKQMTFVDIQPNLRLKKNRLVSPHCEFCKGMQGGLFKCHHAECNRYSHITCILFEKMKIRTGGMESSQSDWTMKLLLEKNPVYANLYNCGGKVDFKTQASSIFNEYKKCEVLFEQNQKRTTSTKKKKNNEELENFLEEVEKKIEIETQSNLKKKESNKGSKELPEPEGGIYRGGNVLLQCYDHKTLEFYCRCQPAIVASENMIACDYCENWFHLECVGIKSVEECEKIAFFYCSLCKEWRKFKSNLLKEIDKPSILSEVFPINRNKDRFRLLDFLFIYKRIIERIEFVLSNPKNIINLDVFTRFLIENLSYIPFKLPKKFEELVKEKFTRIAIDYLVENKFQTFLEDITVVSGFNPQTKLIDRNNLLRIKSLKQNFEKLTQFFSNKGLSLNVQGLVANHKKVKILFCLDQYHQIFTDSKDKPEFEDVLKLNHEFRELGLSYDEYLEAKNLSQMVESFSTCLAEMEKNYLESGNDMEIEAEEVKQVFSDLESYLKAKKSRFQQINSIKLSYDNLKKLINALKEQPFICAAIETPLNDETAKIEKWKKEAQQRPLSAMQLKVLLDNSNELIVKVDELEDLLAIEAKLQLWQSKYNSLQSKITASNATMSEAKDLSSEAEKMRSEIDFSEAFENLTKKIEKTEAINSKLLKLFEKPMEYSAWVKFQKDYCNVELKSDLIEQYQSKIVLCKDVLHLLHKKRSTSESLNQALEEATRNQIDEKIIAEIKEKIQKAAALNERIVVLSGKSDFTDADKREIEEVLSEAKLHKLELIQIKILKGLQEEFNWLEKLFGVYQKVQGREEIEVEGIDVLEDKKLNESVEMESEVEKEKREKMPSLSSLKELLKDNKVIEGNMKLAYSGLKGILVRIFNRNFMDTTVREIFRSYHILVWNYDISNLMTSKPKSDEVMRLYEWGKKENLFNEKLNDFKLKVDEIQDLLASLFEKSQELIKKELLREDCEVIKKELSDLEDNINSSGLILESENNKISSIRSWLNWQLKSTELFSSLKNNKPIEFTRISELLSLAKAISLPIDNSLFVTLSRIFECADSFKEKAKKLQLSKKEVLAALRLAKSENSSRKKVLELNRQKPSLQAAEQLLSEIETKCQELEGFAQIMKEELNFLRAEINLCSELKKKLGDLKERFPLRNIEEVKLMSVADHENIKKEFRAFIQETIWTLGLCMEDWDRKFFIYEMTFQCFYLLSFPQSKSLDFWKNLFNYAEDFQEPTVIETEWFVALRENYKNSKQILSEIEELKLNMSQLGKGENIILYKKENIENLIYRTEKSLINLADYKKFLDDIWRKYKRCEDSFERITKNPSLKLTYQDFLKLYDEIKNLPIEFTGLNDLKAQIGIYENLNKYLERAKRYLSISKPDFKIVKTLIENYEKSFIVINEYQKLIEKYNKSEILLKEIQTTLKNSDALLNFDDLLVLYNKFDEISLNLGDEYEETKIKIWKKKVESIQNLKLNPTGFMISVRQIAIELEIGYSFLSKRSQIPQIIQHISFLENLTESVQLKIREIEQIKDQKKFESIDSTLFNFLDMSELLIEYKTLISLNASNPKINFENKSKNFSLYYNDNMDTDSFFSLLNKLEISSVNRLAPDLTRIFEEKSRKNEKFAFLKEKLEQYDVSKKKPNPISFTSDFAHPSDMFESSKNLQKKIQKSMAASKNEENKKPKVEKKRSVEEMQREETLTRWEKMAKLNPKIKESKKGSNLRFYLKTIENQIFGNYHHDGAKYENEAYNIARLFEAIIKYPHITNNLLANNFSIEIIQKLSGKMDKLSEFEANARRKAVEKQQIEKQKDQINKNKTQILPLSLHQPPQVNLNLKRPGMTLSESPSLQKKPKIQYDPLSSILDKKPSQPQPQASFHKNKPDDDILKTIFGKKLKPEPTTLQSSLSLLTEKKEFNPNPNSPNKKKTPEPKKKKILDKYEALSSDEEKEKKPKNKEDNSKKDEKRLEFSDDDENFTPSEKAYSDKKKFSETSETSEDPFFPPVSSKLGITPPILFDPDNEEIPVEKEKPSKVPRNSILKIYEGKFRINHVSSILVRFLTIEDSGFIQECFPKLSMKDKSTSLKLSGTTDFNTFANFYFGQSNIKKRQMITGWVECLSESHEASLLSFSEELYQTSRVGGYKFGKLSSASFHFIAPQQLSSEQLKNIDFKIRRENNKKPILLFFLTVKTTASKVNEPTMEPEVVDFYDEGKVGSIINLKNMGDEQMEEENLSKEFLIENLPIQAEAEPMQIEKPEIMSPLTNEEDSREETPKDNKNDEDIDELLKNIDTKLPDKNILYGQDTKMDIESKNDDTDLNQILVELQKMGPDELKDFVQSFEPDSRGKIATLLKDYSKEDTAKEEFQYKPIIEYRNYPPHPPMHVGPGGPINKQQNYPGPRPNIGKPPQFGGQNMPPRMYVPPPNQNYPQFNVPNMPPNSFIPQGNIMSQQNQYNPMMNYPKGLLYPPPQNHNLHQDKYK